MMDSFNRKPGTLSYGVAKQEPGGLLTFVYSTEVEKAIVTIQNTPPKEELKEEEKEEEILPPPLSARRRRKKTKSKGDVEITGITDIYHEMLSMGQSIEAENENETPRDEVKKDKFGLVRGAEKVGLTRRGSSLGQKMNKGRAHTDMPSSIQET